MSRNGSGLHSLASGYSVTLACLILQLALIGNAHCAPPPAAEQEPADTASARPRSVRTPPPAARDACNGKKEGDPCRFLTQGGPLDGECLSGAEHIFACRPHRSTAPADRKTVETTDRPAPADTESISQKTATPDAAPKTAQTKGAPAPEVTHSTPLASQPPSTLPLQPAATGKPDLSSESHAAELPGTAAAYITVALLSAALTWIIFFRRSTMPLRRLRNVTQQLAQGNLSARVGEGLVHRKDEVADLARDVDRMAERIEGLVNAHQRLVRDVSHELRSPLARLNVALELARQTAGPDLAAPFDRIDRESGRLNELIGQLLMLTKLESDSNTMQHQSLDLAALITEIVHDVDFEAGSKGRHVAASATEPVLLEANKELLRQALENLIRNAARYTAQDTTVEVSVRVRTAGGRTWAHIEVRDYGPGVPESELYDIFRPFYRVNDARERQSGGSGVGLAIADRAVRLHGGSLRAFNAPGGGLVMELELPVS